VANGSDPKTDQEWADLLSPARRRLLTGAGVTAAAAALGVTGAAAQSATPPGRSPWGYETDKAPTPRPLSVRPHEQTLPTKPRPYTDIKSYHAHIYFDEDSYEKAALLRKWSAERFNIELGDWNHEPRGPHVTPSFYYGFTNDLLPSLVPWLQLNSLGLTILLHPNTDDPRADHLYYTLWVNRAQPVNAYGMKTPLDELGRPRVEQIYNNTRPSVPLEV
jgi:aromatic ring-cleaving dioxygenase